MIALAALACALSVSSAVLALMLRKDPRPLTTPRLSAVLARRRRAASAARALEVLRATQAALRSGQPLALALRSAVGGARPHDDPFVRIARAVELNGDAAQAVRDVSWWSADRRLALALDGLSLAASEQLPSSRAAQLIGSVADRIAYEQRLHDEVVARTAGARSQIVVLALLVPALTVYLLLTMPGLWDTFATPVCRFVLIPMAALLEIAGIAASRATVRGLT